MLKPQQGPLPVPAQTNVTFGGGYFSNTSKNPYSGNYSNLCDSFNLDPNNVTNTTAPTVILDSVAAAGAAYNPSRSFIFSTTKHKS